MRQYLADNVPWGLSPLFNPIGTWARRISYIVFWFAAAYLFFWVIIGPTFFTLINKDVSTVVQTVQHSEGLAFPTITICPKGSGMRCNCMMWKRLACAFLPDRDPMQSQYFSSLICSNPNQIELNRKCDSDWLNLDFANDQCTGLIDSEELFNTIMDRYSDGFPYLTGEEMLVYSGVKFDENITEVSFNDGKFGFPNTVVNASWVDYNFLSLEKMRVCMQVKIPEDELGLGYTMQSSLGTDHGLQIIVNDTFNKQLSSAKADGVNIYLDHNDDPEMEVSLFDKVPVATGKPSTIGFTLESTELLPGYGYDVERNCVPDGELRNVCKKKVRLLSVMERCTNCGRTNYTHIFNVNSSKYQSMGCDYRCLVDDSDTKQATFEECPQRCNMKRGRYTIFTSSLSRFGRTAFLNKWKNADNILQVDVGATSFSERVFASGSATDLPNFIGGLGGNLNLFFGPDMMTAIAYIETVVIGVLLSYRRVPE